MKHITLNLLLLANSILLIMYMGLTLNRNIAFNATGTVSLFLSSLMLIPSPVLLLDAGSLSGCVPMSRP